MEPPMSTPLYPAPRLVVYGKRFLCVSTGKTHPLADLRHFAPRYASEQMPILVDGKFGWLLHDTEGGYRIVVGKPPAPKISVYVRDDRSILSLKDEPGRLTFFGEREARGTLRAIEIGQETGREKVGKNRETQ